jgi:predicted HD superfamily hydrolase involved in NAD metabolism
MKTDFTNLKETILLFIKTNLSPERFKHSLNVSKLAAILAKEHGQDFHKAQIAGLIHDCTKYKSNDEQIAFFNNRPKFKYFDLIANNAPKLLHSYTGAIFAKESWGIKDKDILNAAAYHTLGNENMSLLEKIIYTADAISFEREGFHCAQIRKLAKTDIDAAFMQVMESKIKHCLKKGIWLCPKCVDVWNFYVNKKRQ